MLSLEEIENTFDMLYSYFKKREGKKYPKLRIANDKYVYIIRSKIAHKWGNTVYMYYSFVVRKGTDFVIKEQESINDIRLKIIGEEFFEDFVETVNPILIMDAIKKF